MSGEGGEHGRICEKSRFTITNQCPNCRSTFASRQTAINRRAAAYWSGQCLKHRSVDPLDQLSDLWLLGVE
eukprot:6385993-Pyramimonas_sp.AAC.1